GRPRWSSRPSVARSTTTGRPPRRGFAPGVPEGSRPSPHRRRRPRRSWVGRGGTHCARLGTPHLQATTPPPQCPTKTGPRFSGRPAPARLLGRQALDLVDHARQDVHARVPEARVGDVPPDPADRL